MDFLEKVENLAKVAEEHPLESLRILELFAEVTKSITELEGRLAKLEKMVG